MFKKHYNLKIILVAIVLLLRIDVVYALRPQVGRGLSRTETAIKNEAYKEVAGLPVTYTNDFKKTGLRVSCIQFMNQGFIDNTSRMEEIVLELAELGNDAPDLVIFPEIIHELITKDEAGQREKEFKKLAEETGISIGYFCNIYSPEINMLYYIIKPDGVIKFKKFFYIDKDSPYENRVVSIGGYKVAILICLEAHSIVENNVGRIEIISKDIREYKPELLIIPAEISEDLATRSISGLYEKFKIPVVLINMLHSSVKGKTSFVNSSNPEETISLSRDKERILMVDTPVPKTQTQPLEGPFRVDTEEGRRLCYVREVTDLDEIEKTLDSWFASDEKRIFDRSFWEKVIREYPYCSLLKLESEGELLGLAYFYKEGFLDEILHKFEGMEISKKYRRKDLGIILVAKVIEISMNDPEIRGDLLMKMTLRGEAIKWWDERIGVAHLHGPDRGIYRPRGFEILHEVKNRVVREDLKVEQIEIPPEKSRTEL